MARARLPAPEAVGRYIDIVAARGIAVGRVEVGPDGKIIIIAIGAIEAPVDELDDELKKFEARHGKG